MEKGLLLSGHEAEVLHRTLSGIAHDKNVEITMFSIYAFADMFHY